MPDLKKARETADELKGRADQLERQRDALERGLTDCKERMKMADLELVRLTNDKLELVQLRRQFTTLQEEKGKLQEW